MRAREKVAITRTQGIAGGAGLACHVRINKDDLLTEPFSLVGDEGLELVKAPIVKPAIEPFSFLLLSDSLKVFEGYDVSVSNNFFANYVVCASHVAFLPAAQHFKMPLGGLCAFSLQFTSQMPELLNPSLWSLKKPAITTDGKVVYSEVNPDYLIATRKVGVSLSGECDVPVKNPFLINQFKSLILPIKILPVILRNKDSNILPIILREGSYPNFIKIECEKLTIPANALLFDDWLDFEPGAFQTFACFANSLNSKISRQPLSNIPINKPMQSKTITNLSFKTFINSELHSTRKSFAHLKEHFMP
ncbi:MAG: hypothetical protein Q8N60_04330, partial [Candidatus Diapherotrites archaeon]|nr:hypothetical protein [Candidatus Diapherotrites archaeon]